MARRRFLIAYDIADPKRLRRICKIMEGYGDRMQYSVFISDLNPSELLHTRTEVEEQMLMTEDSVMIVDLGDVADARFLFVGRRRPLPSSSAARIV
jgi:CRISPR-associated protein Cas2